MAKEKLVSEKLKEIAKENNCNVEDIDYEHFENENTLMKWLYDDYTSSEIIELMNVKTEKIIESNSVTVVGYLLSKDSRFIRLEDGSWLFIYDETL